MIIFSKRLLMLKPITLFESSAAGTTTFELPAGRYEITLIGGGGGAAGARSSRTGTKHYAQGGVGGTLQVIVNVYVKSILTITIGDGGVTRSGTFSGAGVSISGDPGGATTITGIPGATLSAGGGTPANFRSTSTSGGNRNVGTMGNNTINGTAVMSILMNNPKNITSNQGSSSGSYRQPQGRANDNWPDDPARGKSGDFGWSGTSHLNMVGASGYVRIRRA